MAFDDETLTESLEYEAANRVAQRSPKASFEHRSAKMSVESVNYEVANANVERGVKNTGCSP